MDRRALFTADDLAIGPVAALRGASCAAAGIRSQQLAQIDLAALRQYPVASTPLSDELARLLVEQLGPDAHPARLVTLDSEDITSLLDLVEATDTVFFGIFACARARIAAGRVCMRSTSSRTSNASASTPWSPSPGAACRRRWKVFRRFRGEFP